MKAFTFSCWENRRKF